MRTILVVEDDEGIRETMAEILEADGFGVGRAANGQEALDWLRENPVPCVMLLDLVMPVLSGAELLELLGEHPQLSSLPVVVVSSFSCSGHVPGVRKFVEKPITREALEAIVDEYCR